MERTLEESNKSVNRGTMKFPLKIRKIEREKDHGTWKITGESQLNYQPYFQARGKVKAEN